VVKQVFQLSKFPVAGCSVVSGRIVRNARARVVRKHQPIYDGAVVVPMQG
jgi:translation initiation factor IF-2